MIMNIDAAMNLITSNPFPVLSYFSASDTSPRLGDFRFMFNCYSRKMNK